MSPGSIWVGSARNLTAARNGAWFSLRIGAHRIPALQNEWNSYGEPSFHFEILETLDSDIAPLLVSDTLKTRKQHWLGTLGAAPLL